jgi:hypothetical protein
MAFVLRLGADGTFTIDGEPVDATSSGYRRSGAYRFEDGWFTSPAINDGVPARLMIDGDRIKLTIDDELTIQFTRV